MQINKKGFVIPLVLAIIALLLVGGTYMYMQKNQENSPVTYSCPDVQKLDYEKTTDTYIQGTDCMPHEGINTLGDPDYEKWVNKNCGIKFKFECSSY